MSKLEEMELSFNMVERRIKRNEESLQKLESDLRKTIQDFSDAVAKEKDLVNSISKVSYYIHRIQEETEKVEKLKYYLTGLEEVYREFKSE